MVVTIEEIEKGYTLHDRVIRPSKVVVGNGETDSKEESKQDNSNS